MSEIVMRPDGPEGVSLVGGCPFMFANASDGRPAGVLSEEARQLMPVLEAAQALGNQPSEADKSDFKAQWNMSFEEAWCRGREIATGKKILPTT